MEAKKIVVVTVLVLALPLAWGEDAFNISDSDPLIWFDRVGHVYPDVNIVHMVLDINTTSIAEALNSLINVAGDPEFVMFDEPHTWLYRTLELEQKYHFAMDFFEQTDSRNSRDIASFVGGLLGLYNSYDLHNLARSVGTLTDATEDLTSQFAVLAHHTNATTTALVELAARVQLLQQRESHSDAVAVFRANWEEIEHEVSAFTSLTLGLARHQVDPQLLRIVPLQDSWREAQEQQAARGKRPAFSQFQYLFLTPMSYASSGSSIRIALHVPFVDITAKPWPAFSPRALPFAGKDRLYWLTDDEGIVAQQPDVDRHLVLHPKELKSAMHFGSTWFLLSGTVRVGREDQSCLGLLWRKDYAAVSAACEIYSRNIYPMAESLNSTTFLVISAEKVLAQIACKGQHVTTTQTQGYQLVSLREECGLATEYYELIPAPRGKDGEVIIHIAPKLELQSPLPYLAQANITLPRLTVSTERIFGLLAKARQETHFSVWIAIAIAAAALLAFATFVFILFVKARGMNIIPVAAAPSVKT